MFVNFHALYFMFVLQFSISKLLVFSLVLVNHDKRLKFTILSKIVTSWHKHVSMKLQKCSIQMWTLFSSLFIFLNAALKILFSKSIVLNTIKKYFLWRQQLLAKYITLLWTVFYNNRCYHEKYRLAVSNATCNTETTVVLSIKVRGFL